VVLEAMNNRTAALDAYRKAIELQPDYAEAKRTEIACWPAQL
jgi:cytochrome c-type biogenesis protein CcmH/NrfG